MNLMKGIVNASIYLYIDLLGAKPGFFHRYILGLYELSGIW